MKWFSDVRGAVWVSPGTAQGVSPLLGPHSSTDGSLQAFGAIHTDALKEGYSRGHFLVHFICGKHAFSRQRECLGAGGGRRQPPGDPSQYRANTRFLNLGLSV